jgi:hypothetical protein
MRGFRPEGAHRDGEGDRVVRRQHPVGRGPASSWRDYVVQQSPGDISRQAAPEFFTGGAGARGACKVTSRSRPRRSSPVILQPVVRRHSLLRNRELEHALGVFVVCTMSDPTIRTANTEDQALRTPAQRRPCELYPGHCAAPPWRADALVTGVPPTGSRSKGPMRLPLTSPTDRRCLVGPW